MRDPARTRRKVHAYRVQWEATGSLWTDQQEATMATEVMDALEAAFGLRAMRINVATDVDVDPGWPYSREDELLPSRRRSAERHAVQYAERKRVEARRAAAALAEKDRLERAELLYRRRVALPSTNPLRVFGDALPLADFVALLTARR